MSGVLFFMLQTTQTKKTRKPYGFICNFSVSFSVYKINLFAKTE